MLFHPSISLWVCQILFLVSALQSTCQKVPLPRCNSVYDSYVLGTPFKFARQARRVHPKVCCDAVQLFHPSSAAWSMAHLLPAA